MRFILLVIRFFCLFFRKTNINGKINNFSNSEQNSVNNKGPDRTDMVITMIR